MKLKKRTKLSGNLMGIILLMALLVPSLGTNRTSPVYAQGAATEAPTAAPTETPAAASALLVYSKADQVFAFDPATGVSEPLSNWAGFYDYDISFSALENIYGGKVIRTATSDYPATSNPGFLRAVVNPYEDTMYGASYLDGEAGAVVVYQNETEIARAAASDFGGAFSIDVIGWLDQSKLLTAEFAVEDGRYSKYYIFDIESGEKASLDKLSELTGYSGEATIGQSPSELIATTGSQIIQVDIARQETVQSWEVAADYLWGWISSETIPALLDELQQYNSTKELEAQSVAPFLYWPLPSNHTVACAIGCYTGHKGTDIGVSTSNNTPVYAAAEGTVYTVVKNKPYGSARIPDAGQANYVRIKHVIPTSTGGTTTYYTAYYHMSTNIKVAVGQKVYPGTLLGYGSNSGLTCGNQAAQKGCMGYAGSFYHLHFEVDGSCATSTCWVNPYTTNLWIKNSNGSIKDPPPPSAVIIPKTPTITAASDGTIADYVELTYVNVSDATRYEIWRNTSNNSATAAKIFDDNGSAHHDATAVPGVVYYYWVKACNANGCSGFSNTDSGYRVNLSAIPGIPATIDASDGKYTDYVTVTWGAVSGATSYEIWRNTTNTTTGAALRGTSTGTSYNDTNAVAGSFYYYWVKACNLNGCSGFSGSNVGQRGQVSVILIDRPTLTPAYSGDMCGSAWKQITGYGDAKAFLTLNTNQASQSTNSAIWQPNLPATGIYKVEAYVPYHPVVTWQCPTKTISYDTSQAKYTIYHSTGSTVVTKDQKPLSNAWMSLGNFTLNAGTASKVKLVDLNGESNLTRTIAFSAMRFTLISLSPPASFNKSSPVNAETGTVTEPALSWTASSGATSYEYCYDTSNNNTCDAVWTSTGTATTAALSGLSPSSTYYWQVRTLNAGGATYANSNTWWSFTTAAQNKPDFRVQVQGYYPPSPLPSDTIYINVLVENIGSQAFASDSGAQALIGLYVDQPSPAACQVLTDGNAYLPFDSLAAGDSMELTLEVGTLASGPHEITAVVDADCSVPELNESNNQNGPVTLTVAPPLDAPPNDDIDSAASIPSTPFSTTLNPMGATGVYDDPDFAACGQSKGENSVWYEFTPSRNGRITVSTMGSSYDTVLGIWAGTRGSLSSLGCNDDYLGTSSQVTADLRASTKYYIEVDQYMGPLPGMSMMAQSKAPADDLFSLSEDALVLNVAYNILVPAAPILVSPATGIILKEYAPNLDWKDQSPLPDHYQVQIATTNTFLPVSLVQDQTTTGSLFPANLLAGKIYYWRVRAFNGLGQAGPWSLVRSIRTGWLPPALIEPVHEQALQNKRPAFSWVSVSGAGSYNLQVSKYGTFASPAINVNVKGTTYIPSIDLGANTLYYWRMRTNGVNGPSGWSEVRTFTTANPPGTPLASLPAANALNTDYLPLFKWSAVSSPLGTDFDHYQIQVDDDSTFSSTAIDTNATSPQYQAVTKLAPNLKYYWRVRSFNSLGHYSAWSALRYFRTVMTAPVLNNPGNESTVSSLKPVFDWEDVTGAATYTIQVSLSPAFSTLLINSSVKSSTYPSSVTLSSKKIVYWRVRANGLNGPTMWTTFSFTTP